MSGRHTFLKKKDTLVVIPNRLHCRPSFFIKGAYIVSPLTEFIFSFS